MSTDNVSLQLDNGVAMSFEIEIRTALLQFQADYLAYLAAVSSGNHPKGPTSYEIKKGETKQTIAIDFSKVIVVSITPDGGSPA